ncbi:MAG: TraR/DksA C4-type zinc finger protein [Patescibacteria group bacterium]|nr:TraR/DksA C4-type zinc finger protein [Patescibacteria group bacterium]
MNTVPAIRRPIFAIAEKMRQVDRLLKSKREALMDMGDEQPMTLMDQVSFNTQRDQNVALVVFLDQSRRQLEETLGNFIESIYLLEYGQCRICGHPIPDERLEAIPGTTLCVHCAAKA